MTLSALLPELENVSNAARYAEYNILKEYKARYDGDLSAYLSTRSISEATRTRASIASDMAAMSAALRKWPDCSDALLQTRVEWDRYAIFRYQRIGRHGQLGAYDSETTRLTGDEYHLTFALEDACNVSKSHEIEVILWRHPWMSDPVATWISPDVSGYAKVYLTPNDVNDDLLQEAPVRVSESQPPDLSGPSVEFYYNPASFCSYSFDVNGPPLDPAWPEPVKFLKRAAEAYNCMVSTATDAWDSDCGIEAVAELWTDTGKETVRDAVALGVLGDFYPFESALSTMTSAEVVWLESSAYGDYVYFRPYIGEEENPVMYISFANDDGTRYLTPIPYDQNIHLIAGSLTFQRVVRHEVLGEMY